MRSLLFVPGDSRRKMEKGLGSGADALIVDLEDSVAPSAKENARRETLEFLREIASQAERPRIVLRVNALETGLTDADLAGVMEGRPDYIILPKTDGGRDVQHLAAKLAVHEAELGLQDGATKILALSTETARSLFTLGSIAGSSHRLAAVTWGAEDLSADVGAETNRDEAGEFTAPYRLARSLALFAAAAAEVDAIDTVFTNFRDDAALRRECQAARRDGFVAKMAIHPGQVAAINEVFTPSPEAVANARTIVAAFEAAPDAGVVGIEGEMIDRPHLRRAERILARVAAR